MSKIRRLAITLAASAGLITISAEAANAGLQLANHCPPLR
jgi:hypothetical protein